MINVVDAVTLAPLLEQEPGAIERIRELRNEASVRKHMYNDHLISQAEHEGWLASLRNNPHTRIWAILFKGKIQGAVSLTAIDLKHKTADWAFYLSPATQGKGVGGIVEFKLLELAFGEMGLEKLNCEVLVTNPQVIKMHEKFGFRLEGTRRANILKDGRRRDVALLGVQAHEWQEARSRFTRLYGTQ